MFVDVLMAATAKFPEGDVLVALPVRRLGDQRLVAVNIHISGNFFYPSACAWWERWQVVTGVTRI